jgi:hypothetical protein
MLVSRPRNAKTQARVTVHNDTFKQLLNSTDAARFLKINPKTLQSLAREVVAISQVASRLVAQFKIEEKP